MYKKENYIFDGKVTMDIYSLRSAYYELNPDYHWFDDGTLKFFGNRLSEMRVLKKLYQITDYLGNTHECYCVSYITRPPYCQPYRKYTYFDTTTLLDIEPQKEVKNDIEHRTK